MNDSSLRIVTNDESAERGFGRRDMILRLLGAAGAGFVIPGLASAHPIHLHLANGETMAAADAKTTQLDWQPVFFDAHQNETVIVLAEQIVPNSTRARVNRFIDTLISVDTQENQKRFLSALGAFDHEAITRHNQPFKTLNEKQQSAILTEASTAESSESRLSVRRRRPRTVPKPDIEGSGLTLHDHFENIKGWVSGAFYSSEVGMRELGWTGQVDWESLPGCTHADGHA